MEKIEAAFQALKEQGGKAIGLVAQFSNLSTRLPDPGGAAQAGRRARRPGAEPGGRPGDQHRRSGRSLAGPAGRYRDNPDASLEIHQLLNSVDAEMKRIRSEYTRVAS